MKELSEALGVPVPQLSAIVEQAVEEWPGECCGVIVGAAKPFGADPQRWACRNLIDELHEAEPETYTRTSKDGFVIDPIRQLEIDRHCRETGRDYYVFYHSHIDCDAYFSEEDQAAALFPFDEPNFPEAWHLVVSVYDRKPKAAFLCRWDPETRTFPGRLFPLAEPAP